MRHLQILVLLTAFIPLSCSTPQDPDKTNEKSPPASNQITEQDKVTVKQMDSNLRLHDIWALESIGSKQLDLGDRQKRPQLEINLQKMTLSGNDGCNNFSGGIKHVDSEKMIFGTIGATRKACIDMDIPDKFHRQINNVQAYSIKDLKLHLFDGLGNELFCFRKTD